ncbi:MULTISPECIES: hypothetical protein [Niastella]|uniref:Uncharacterized protein n=1 Tax=Niastella soli TaxID=2821487 RepID=A0ABS3Z3L9_9BACT|nr:hypothetical protein [Niastella soli]MBO9204235.1 hypothetical protein [Niastella soli]
MESYKDKLLEAMFPLVDDLLEKYGEFFPLGAAILRDDGIASLATYDGDERPKSDAVIADLKEAIKAGFKKREYKAAVIFYDIYVTHPETNIKSAAVAINYESVGENSGFIFFFPYKFSEDKELSYDPGWYDEVPKELFIEFS